ncbi:hypothetical protein K2X33_09960 [bacterium]|nr:hypothetical protein [bacterium]
MSTLKSASWKFLVVPLVLGLFSCASPRVAQDAPAPVTPGVPVPEGTPVPPTSPPRSITLVVGGTGVASYATVGLLKKLHEEGVEIELIIATGWPAVFALANGFLRSIHDLEWFATRLDRKDFERIGSVDFRRDLDPREALKGIILDSFPQMLISESRTPVVISATNTDLGELDVYGSGEWKEPLLKTASVPGVFRPFLSERGSDWMAGITGLDVREALRRGATHVVAMGAYNDFLSWIVQKEEGNDAVSRRQYASQLRKSNQEAMKQAAYSIDMDLRRAPLDFGAKRAAILAGYREGAKLIRKLREPASSTTAN